MSEPDEPEALPGLRQTVRASRAVPAKRKAAKAAAAEPAAVDPVARVLVDVPLAHLDRTFDYLVPAAMADDAVPGTRVKVRFAGQEVGGYLLGRGAESDHPGRLTPLRRVVSAEPVLSPAVAALAGDVAARYAGTRSDVLRLAVPPRHAGHRAGRAGPGRRAAAVRRGRGRRGVGRAPAGRGLPASPGRGGVAEGRLGDAPRGPTGRCCSPTRPRRRTPAPGVASCCACPTPRTSPASTPR